MLSKKNEEIAIDNLQKNIFAKLSDKEKADFVNYATEINLDIKLVAHLTTKDKPKFKSINYIRLAKKHKLNILITDFSDTKSIKSGWKNIFIFKYEILRGIILDAEKIISNSNLYHFVQGKLYSYTDKEVIDFISNLS